MTRLCRLVPASVFCFVVAPAHAAGGAQNWLLRIHQAPQTLNYDGTFVYQHSGRIDTMRIFHRAVDGAVTERLVALTGPPREVVRNDQEVRCYLPDQNSIFVERRRLDRTSFLAIVPDRLPDLEQSYEIQLGGKGRVAGRATQQLMLRARDAYRYSYKLWADQDTGLLLKAELVNDEGKKLEQFMFTQLNVGGDIPDSTLVAHTPVEGMAWYRDEQVTEGGPTRSWQAMRLPSGFRLFSNVVRRLPRVPKDHRVVRQLVYTDSLAAVSVFIEKLGDSNNANDMVEGPTSMGALNAFGRILDGHHVTVVGEVPAKTIVLISDSLVPAPGR
jgi:sigma-E factor negative regulatory protein RseB